MSALHMDLDGESSAAWALAQIILKFGLMSGEWTSFYWTQLVLPTSIALVYDNHFYLIAVNVDSVIWFSKVQAVLICWLLFIWVILLTAQWQPKQKHLTEQQTVQA